MGISVLMSIYAKENPDYLKQSLDSIYDQMLMPDEIVVVEDGKLGKDLSSILDDYHDIKRIKSETNIQLGRALALGLKNCNYELIARMDSDDIARKNRLKIQKEYMDNHLDISAIGGDIAEFIETDKDGKPIVLREKHMPTASKALYDYGKYRNPLNHMTVMFRKKDIEEVGGYEHMPLLEDYLLWSKLLAAGRSIANISEILVDARIDEKFASKRGGIEYYKRYKKLRKMQHEMGYTSRCEYIKGMILSAIMTLQPQGMRSMAYKLLRQREKKELKEH